MSQYNPSRSPGSHGGKKHATSERRQDRRHGRHTAGSEHQQDIIDDVENFTPEHMSIEADVEFDDGGEFSGLGDGDEENVEFQAEHREMFHDIYEEGENAEPTEGDTSASGKEKNRYVIPKLKREYQQDPSYGTNNDEEKREWRRSERDSRHGHFEKREKKRDDGDADRGERDRERRKHDNKEKQMTRSKHSFGKDSPNDHPSLESSRKELQMNNRSLFENFAAEGLIATVDLVPSQVTESVKQISGEEKKVASEVEEEIIGKEQEAEAGPLEEEDEELVEIPVGRDSLASVRDYYPWQIRVYPVNRKDMPRSDFAQVWAMADSSSIVWSDHKKFGGVAEFLLKDRENIQKFMRKILWHSYVADIVTVEITERSKLEKDTDNDVEQKDSDVLDSVVNQVAIRFHNTRGRQLIKTYYPTPKGEVTERSLYVNNVGTGVSTDLMKAIFPCALKISVAKAGKEASSALVETESEEAAFNYLVVYHKIRINGLDLMLSTLTYDWEGAKIKFRQSAQARKKQDVGDKLSLFDKSITTGKRASTSYPDSRPAKRERQTSSARSQDAGSKERSKSSRGALHSRGKGLSGRGKSSARGRGRGLLPIPPIPVVGGREGLLPHPELHPPSLLALPAKPNKQGLLEAGFILNQDVERRTAELQEIQMQLESQVLETRATLARAARQAEARAIEDDYLEHRHRIGLMPRPERALLQDYIEEERPREQPRRTLLSTEGRPRLAVNYPEEELEYRRPRPASQIMATERGDYMPRGYARERREDDYEDSRLADRPRPYLLEAPPAAERQVTREEKDPYSAASLYDYETTPSRSLLDPELISEKRRIMLRQASALERERNTSSHDLFDYEGREARRPPSYSAGHRGYEEESRKVPTTIRYKEEYEHHY